MQSRIAAVHVQFCAAATVSMHVCLLAVSVAVHGFCSLVYTTCSEVAVGTLHSGSAGSLALLGVSASRACNECCGECPGQSA
jgi:hypothetical protein